MGREPNDQLKADSEHGEGNSKLFILMYSEN